MAAKTKNSLRGMHALQHDDIPVHECTAGISHNCSLQLQCLQNLAFNSKITESLMRFISWESMAHIVGLSEGIPCSAQPDTVHDCRLCVYSALCSSGVYPAPEEQCSTAQRISGDEIASVHVTLSVPTCVPKPTKNPFQGPELPSLRSIRAVYKVDYGAATCTQKNRALLTPQPIFNNPRKRSAFGAQASRSTLLIPHSAAAVIQVTY